MMTPSGGSSWKVPGPADLEAITLHRRDRVYHGERQFDSGCRDVARFPATAGYQEMLSEMGVGKDQSARWRKLAATLVKRKKNQVFGAS